MFVSHSSNSGFTLLETTIVLFIVGIMAAIAAPSWLQFIQSQQARSAQGLAHQLMLSLVSETRKNSITCYLEFSQVGEDVEINPYCGDHPISGRHRFHNVQLSTCSFPKRRRPFSGSNQKGVKVCAPAVEMGKLRQNNLGSVCFSDERIKQEYCAKYSTLIGGRRMQTRPKRR